MRTEQDFLGEVSLPADAYYGIHSFRARENFPDAAPFSLHWYKAMGTVKVACYQTVRKFSGAVKKEYPELLKELRLPPAELLDAMEEAASEISTGRHFEHFIVSANQGGAGTSINLNINEIICNRALHLLGHSPGQYSLIDPIEGANIYQSTNDVVPTALTLASMQLIEKLEAAINQGRSRSEALENRYRNSLRLGYTQMQEAVPSTFGQLFSTYSEALSRDWWRSSKATERLKVVNLGGGAIGTGISIPRFYIMEVVPALKRLSGLPLTQGENLCDATANLDRWVEVHAILKAHAVNLEKMASDLRLLASGVNEHAEVSLPARQVGSSIMPGKINPVIPEYIISSAHKVYDNDALVSRLAGMGCLDLNAYLPAIGSSMLESLDLLISMNTALSEGLLKGLTVNEETARKKLFMSPAVTTALTPLIGYHRAAKLANEMKHSGSNVFEANRTLGILEEARLAKAMEASSLLKRGFSMKDVREMRETL